MWGAWAWALRLKHEPILQLNTPSTPLAHPGQTQWFYGSDREKNDSDMHTLVGLISPRVIGGCQPDSESGSGRFRIDICNTSGSESYLYEIGSGIELRINQACTYHSPSHALAS